MRVRCTCGADLIHRQCKRSGVYFSRCDKGTPDADDATQARVDALIRDPRSALTRDLQTVRDLANDEDKSGAVEVVLDILADYGASAPVVLTRYIDAHFGMVDLLNYFLTRGVFQPVADPPPPTPPLPNFLQLQGWGGTGETFNHTSTLVQDPMFPGFRLVIHNVEGGVEFDAATWALEVTGAAQTMIVDALRALGFEPTREGDS